MCYDDARKAASIRLALICHVAVRVLKCNLSSLGRYISLTESSTQLPEPLGRHYAAYTLQNNLKSVIMHQKTAHAFKSSGGQFPRIHNPSFHSSTYHSTKRLERLPGFIQQCRINLRDMLKRLIQAKFIESHINVTTKPELHQPSLATS